MESKFKPGDRVRVINYGHPMWTTYEGYYSFSQAIVDYQSEMLYGVKGLIEVKDPVIISKNEDALTIDSSPELIGQEGVIVGSYLDLYPQYSSEDYPEQHERHKHEYSIDGIPAKSAWYNEDQLELI